MRNVTFIHHLFNFISCIALCAKMEWKNATIFIRVFLRLGRKKSSRPLRNIAKLKNSLWNKKHFSGSNIMLPEDANLRRLVISKTYLFLKSGGNQQNYLFNICDRDLAHYIHHHRKHRKFPQCKNRKITELSKGERTIYLSLSIYFSKKLF